MPARKRKQPEPEASSSDVDPSKMKVTELREELETRGLDSTGKKADLVARLEDALKPSDPCPSPTKKAKGADTVEPVDYSKMKVAALREELETRGLDPSGKKADLVARLEDALKSSGTGTETKPAKKATTKKEPVKKEPKVSVKKEPKVSVKKEPEASAAPADEGGVDESDFSKAVRALKSTKPSTSKKTFNRKVDSFNPSKAMCKVYMDWDCMLNQTNIGQNNNKFYVIQLVEYFGLYGVWTRWGRVGEFGQNDFKTRLDLDSAKKAFAKKFNDKTKNKWDNRAKFSAVPGKYTLLEMDDESGDEEEVISKLAAIDEPDAPPAKVKSCSLDKPTQSLMKLIFDNDMFKDAMKSMEIDTKKMPLGKLSKLQIAKGFEALEGIETALKAKAPRSKIAEMTSKFYTIIPHDFGRRIPPVIDDPETLQKKFDMLVVLGDIEIAQGLKNKEEKPKTVGEEVPHPLDVNYELLKAQLDHVDKKHTEYPLLEKYLRATEPQWNKLEIMDIWRVDRQEEGDRFQAHDAIDNRRLLWHGTNVAVVAAILKSGLRIMPHSGGRVGKGIYFASECSKSAGYVRRTANNIGIMFLNEVALGNEHHITRDDWTLTKPPTGYDSIIAKGCTEPDPSQDDSIDLDGKTVTVPQGKPLRVPEFLGSSFSQSEYLVYKENQARIRYLLKLKF